MACGGGGEPKYYKNVGSANVADFDETTGDDNPFKPGVIYSYQRRHANGGFGAAEFVFPSRSDCHHTITMGDIDGDGDLDLLIGGGWAFALLFFPNVGTPTAPSFVNDTTGGYRTLDPNTAVNPQVGAPNPFRGILPVGQQPSSKMSPTLFDVDGDGDLDLLIGLGNDGVVKFYLNVGTRTMASFQEQAETTNPFQLGFTFADGGHHTTFADYDGDGAPHRPFSLSNTVLALTLTVIEA